MECAMSLTTTHWILLSVVIIIEVILKGFALWASARRKQKAWFVCLLILNTAGILPIIYLLIHRKK